MIAPCFRFEATQFLPRTRSELWPFFVDPHNLAKITPPELGMRCDPDGPHDIYPGLVLRHRVRLFPLVTVTWVTEISHVVPGTMFVDEQRRGPYVFWHHQHWFDDAPGGTMMRDIVHYVVPGGPLAGLIDRWNVRPRLEHIFAHRRGVLEQMYPSSP
jgi:ligand-binding SRPBCC domain-containing protein